MRFHSVWINGKIIPAKNAKISIYNSSFLNGIGVFETMKSVDGKVLFLPLHLKRFFKNIRKSGLKTPYSQTQLSREIKTIALRHSNHTLTIRMTLSRDENQKPHLVIAPRNYEAISENDYKKGGKIVFIKSVMADSPTLSSLKTTSYLTKILARAEAQKRGAVEGLLVTEKGFVTEGSSSNIFIVKDGSLITPPLDDGLLAGTRRHVVLRLAKKLKIKAQEKSLRAKDIFTADEVFITSALKDVLPIRQVEDRKISKMCPGRITKIFMKEFLKA